MCFLHVSQEQKIAKFIYVVSFRCFKRYILSLKFFSSNNCQRKEKWNNFFSVRFCTFFLSLGCIEFAFKFNWLIFPHLLLQQFFGNECTAPVVNIVNTTLVLWSISEVMLLALISIWSSLLYHLFINTFNIYFMNI